MINPSFQGVNRLFVLSFENENDRTLHSNYYLPKVEIKDYNVIIDGKNFFDQSINSNLKTYENIRKIAISQADDYTTGCLLGYSYFKEIYKMIPIDLSKQFNTLILRKLWIEQEIQQCSLLLKKKKKLY